MKHCSSCNKERPLKDFYKNGTYPICKYCNRIRCAKSAKKSGRDKKRERTLEEKKSLRKHQSDYRKRNPGKAKTRELFRSALKRGSLTKKPCEICGNKKVEGHHENYDMPLDVTWLCRKHHIELHKSYNAIAREMGVDNCE